LESVTSSNEIEDLDFLMPPVDRGGISVRRSHADEADTLAQIAAREIGPTIANVEVIREVMRYNGECFFTVLQHCADSMTPNIAGFHAYMVLNKRGTDAAAAGEFGALDPDFTMLCRDDETPFSLWGWGVVARGGIYKTSMPLVMLHLKEPRYRHLNIYARAGTDAGRRMGDRHGFVPIRGEAAPLCTLVYYRQMLPRLARDQQIPFFCEGVPSIRYSELLRSDTAPNGVQR
jgi:hypothetical protein